MEDLYLDALVPPSTFLKIRQNRLLPELEIVGLTLDTVGIEEYINWLLSFEVGGDHQLKNASAFFHTVHRFVAAKQHFITWEAEILCAGIHATLRRCDCYGHSESEGSEGGGDEDDDGG